MLGLEKITPNYIVEEESKLVNTSLRGLERAVKYEEKTRSSDKRILVECLEIIDREKGEKKIGKWEERRRKTLEWAGIREEVREKRKENETKEVVKWIGEKITGKIENERMEKLKNSRYNKEYIEIRGEQRPRYLEDRRKKYDSKVQSRE